MTVLQFKPRREPIDLDDLSASILAASARRDIDAAMLVDQFLDDHPGVSTVDLHRAVALAHGVLRTFYQLALSALGSDGRGGDAA
jgi:hypothetical protein